MDGMPFFGCMPLSNESARRMYRKSKKVENPMIREYTGTRDRIEDDKNRSWQEEW